MAVYCPIIAELINNYLKLLTLSDLGQFTAKVTSILLLVTLKKLRINGQKCLLNGNLLGNIHSVTGRPVTNRKKQK
jgi:hypothetical protein